MKRALKLFHGAAASLMVTLAVLAAGCGSSTTTDNATPILSNISPSDAVVGSGGLTLQVVALNALTNSVVLWNQTALTTTYNKNTGDLEAQVPASFLTKQGSAEITVNNPSPGGGLSNSLTFFINPPNNPAPTITSISPSSAGAGGAGFTLVVTGTGFVASSVVSWKGSPRTTAFVSSTELKATIVASDIATPGKADVTVVNPSPGGGVSAVKVFTITDPAAVRVGASGAGLAADAVQVSVSAAGAAADGVSGAPRVSASGRFVAFESRARNLVGVDASSGVGEVFVRDTCVGAGVGAKTEAGVGGGEQDCTARTEAVDVSAEGSEPDAPAARGLGISASGRYVVFASRAGNLLGSVEANTRSGAAAGEENVGVSAGMAAQAARSAAGAGNAQVYLRDTCLDVDGAVKCEPATYLVSVASRPGESAALVAGDGASEFPSISADGRYVSFTSKADDLVAGTRVTGGDAQIYLRDTCVGARAEERCVARTELVSAGMRGEAGAGASLQSSISATGRYVAFDSAAVNLADGAASGVAEVFVRDTCAGVGAAGALSTNRGDAIGAGVARCKPMTTLASMSVLGAAANGASFEPAISGDGQHVAFVTRAGDIGEDSIAEGRASQASGAQRIVMRDMCAGAAGCEASSVVVSNAGEGVAHAPSISGDGRVVTFVADGGNVSHAGGLLRVYVWKACASESLSSCVAKAMLLAQTPAGEAAALPSGGARFAVPVSGVAGMAAIFSVPAPGQSNSPAALSGEGDVFLIKLPN